MKIIIVGGGETGQTLANVLAGDHDVTVIEKEEPVAKALANKTSALVVRGDGVDVSVLKEAGIESADAVIAVTADDKTNMMVCQIAKNENIRKIISLVNTPKDEELFTKLGITSLVSSVGTNVLAVKKALYEYGDERIIAQLGGGDVQIIEQTVAKGSTLIGKKASIKNAVIATIYRAGELIIPNQKTVLKEGDVLIVVVKTRHLASVSDLIKAK